MNSRPGSREHLRHLLHSEADVSFICNPNNPTGNLRKKEEITEALSTMASHGGMLFCDEAFIDLSDPRESVSGICDPHLFVLQSLTKSFAVPGLRFGYGFGDPDLIEKIEISRPPWSVNAYAEAFALQAFSHLDESGEIADSDSQGTGMAFRTGDRSWPASPSVIGKLSSHRFRMCRVPLCEKLAECDILVRDCTSFGLPAVHPHRGTDTRGEPDLHGGTRRMLALIMAGGEGSRLESWRKTAGPDQRAADDRVCHRCVRRSRMRTGCCDEPEDTR